MKSSAQVLAWSTISSWVSSFPWQQGSQGQTHSQVNLHPSGHGCCQYTLLAYGKCKKSVTRLKSVSGWTKLSYVCHGQRCVRVQLPQLSWPTESCWDALAWVHVWALGIAKAVIRQTDGCVKASGRQPHSVLLKISFQRWPCGCRPFL